MRGCAAIAASTAAEKPSRSTASAPPAGTWCASAQRMISEPIARISRWMHADRVVLAVVGAERVGADEFGETLGRCASVPRSGRISCRTTGTPARGDLPGCFAAGEAAADDMDGFHGALVTKPGGLVNRRARPSRRPKRKRPPGEDPAGARCAGGRRLGGARPRPPRVVESGGDALAHDEFDVAAANADVVEFAVAQARHSRTASR